VGPFIWNYLFENDMEGKDSIGVPENNTEGQGFNWYSCWPTIDTARHNSHLSNDGQQKQEYIAKIEQSNEHRQCAIK
jgi:hypothetical protein